MPLSDDEERQLDEIERELAYGDPKLAAAAVPDRDSQRPFMIATAELFLGIAVLLTGLVISQGPVALGWQLSWWGYRPWFDLWSVESGFVTTTEPDVTKVSRRAPSAAH